MVAKGVTKEFQTSIGIKIEHRDRVIRDKKSIVLTGQIRVTELVLQVVSAGGEGPAGQRPDLDPTREEVSVLQWTIVCLFTHLICLLFNLWQVLGYRIGNIIWLKQRPQKHIP